LIATWKIPLAVVQDRVTQALAQLRCAELSGTLKRKDLEAEAKQDAEETWALEDKRKAVYAAWQERQRLV
jgi:hypothetical protein